VRDDRLDGGDGLGDFGIGGKEVVVQRDDAGESLAECSGNAHGTHSLGLSSLLDEPVASFSELLIGSVVEEEASAASPAIVLSVLVCPASHVGRSQLGLSYVAVRPSPLCGIDGP